jgi:hypothetical protein
MYQGKYGAENGFNPAWKLLMGTYKKMHFSANHSAVFPRYVKPPNFAKRQPDTVVG